jgi:hypothetical protein
MEKESLPPETPQQEEEVMMRPSKRSRKSKYGDHSSLVEGPRFAKVESIRRLYKGPEVD